MLKKLWINHCPWKKFKPLHLTIIWGLLLIDNVLLPSLHFPTRLLEQKHSVIWIYIRFKKIKSLTPYLDLIALIIINRKRTKTLIGFEIISNFSTCRPLPITQGINPHGLQPNELWQMDVTLCPELSPFSFLHVCIDTNSSFIWITPLRGEATQRVIPCLYF